MDLKKCLTLAVQQEKRLLVRPDAKAQIVQARIDNLAEQMAGVTMLVKKGHGQVTPGAARSRMIERGCPYGNNLVAATAGAQIVRSKGKRVQNVESAVTGR